MMKNIKIIRIGLILALFLFCGSDSGLSRDNEIYIINVSSAISPGIADFIKSGIKKASDDRVACVVIRLNTPGGLAESMRGIVMDILGSQVPVVVYVAPSGARAASAGVMITIAADIAAMAPGTNIGAAHPVGIGGKKIDKTMSEKVVNDMVAHVKSVAGKRGRNVEWVEKAVRESVSVTATEALKENIIDIIATDMDDLIRQINGRKVADKGVLSLNNVKQTELEEGFRTKILKTISDPNIAYILLMIGLAGLYFELSHPGSIFPGVIGGIAIVLAFFAFQTLPVNYAGFLLIFLALVFFIMELKITSYGLLSIAGVVSFLLGSIMLFEVTSPEIKVSWRVILPTLGVVSGFFVAVAGLVFKAQVSRPQTGADGMFGKIGVVKSAIDPEGKVLVHGELWKARARDRIPEGASVRVVKVVDLVLEVEPAEEK
jgi:membrane-bound serine protease (ClpP class)